MLEIKEKKTDVGVIIGRFQSPSLHDGHVELIEWVLSRHQKVLIFLGMSVLKGTINNPLDYEARKQMILAKFPEANVFYIKDCRSDESWSKILDEKISDVLTPSQSATLYGSRDSFIPFYSGKFNVVELSSSHKTSATEIRNKVSQKCIDSDDFRSGVVWAAYNQYPSVLATVDVAIFCGDKSKVLLGRKKHENKFRFIGGFTDVNSDSFEADARREAMEETNLEISDLQYVGSFRIDDWRYRRERNKITTTFFLATKQFGKEEASDDIEEIRWFDYLELTSNDIVKEHEVLFNALKSKI